MTTVAEPAAPPQLLDKQELARLLRVSAKTLDGWRRDSDFPQPVHQPGRRRLWSVGDVAAYLDSRSTQNSQIP